MADEQIGAEARRFSLVGRLAGLTFILMLVCTGAIIGSRRAAAAQAACLQVDAGSSRTLIDIQNGFHANGQGQTPLQRSRAITHVNYSPDRRSLAYLEDDRACRCTHLVIRPVTWAAPDQVRRVADDVPEWTRLDWSPDSQSIAYYWADPTGTYLMGITGLDGQGSQVATLGNGMIPYGWSADSAYFAFGERLTPDYPQTLALWSRATGQITELGLNKPVASNSTAANAASANPPVTLVAWAPNGHQLAFLSPGADNTNRLFLFTPGNAGDYAMFDVSGVQTGAELFWSPDGHYVALTTVDSSTKVWQLGIFGIQGEQFHSVSTRIVSQSTFLYPEAAWETTGRAFIYMEYADPAHLKTARLMAFHLDTGQAQVLLPEALADWFAFPDKHYVQTAWQQPTEAVLGLVDALTGAKIPLTPLSNTGVLPVLGVDPLHRGSTLELSPDGTMAAMLLRQGNGAVFELASVDGSWRREIPLDIARESDGVLRLRWSPDSRAVLMTYSVNSLTAFRIQRRNILDTTIDVIGLDGNTAYHDTYASEFEPQITWSSCRIDPIN